MPSLRLRPERNSLRPVIAAIANGWYCFACPFPMQAPNDAPE